MPERDLHETLHAVFGWPSPPCRTSLDLAIKVFFTDRGLHPRPFQQQMFERVAGGESILLVAGTAQGKTEAVMVPVAAALVDAGRQTMCCYLAPTRALLNDLLARLAFPLGQLGLRIVVRHGDRHINQDDTSVDVLLTTPESLDVMLQQRAIVLQRTRIVVLDEVHQLYGTPRGAQVISLLERLKRYAEPRETKSLQRVGLSATVGDGEAVAKWLTGTDRPIETIFTPTGRVIDASVEWCSSEQETARWITGASHRKMLVFVNSRGRCEELAAALEAESSAEVLVHYSDLDVGDREYVEDRFRRADRAICVATGTLELGIDIGTIDAVVMADPAFSVQAFLQRVGRAARTQSTVPVLIPVCSVVDLAHQLALVSLATQGRIEETTYPEWYSVLAQQVLSIVAGRSRRRIFELEPEEMFGCWPWFDSRAARDLLDGLVAAEYLEREAQIRSYRQGRSLAVALDGWGVSSNIAGQAGGVPLYHGRRRIGNADLPVDAL